MPNYSQWFVNATNAAAKDAFDRMCREGGGVFYLYFKPHGLAFKVVRDDEQAGEGFELVMSERIPGDRTLQQLSMLFSEKCGRVPVLPAD